MKSLQGLFLLLVLSFAGCADNSPSSPLPSPTEATQFAGYWELDLTVTSRSNCGSAAGTRQTASVILGTGAYSAYLSIFQDLIPLEIDGSRATGIQRVGNTTYVVELVAGEKGLSGNLRVTRTLFDSTTQCVNDYDLKATRSADPPALEDESDWEVLISARESSCLGVSPTLFQECLSLRRDGFAVSMQWPAGELAGTATDGRIVLMQIVENSAIRIDVDLDGDILSGELHMTDIDADCSMVSDVEASRSSKTCPPPPLGKLPWFLSEARTLDPMRGAP